VKWKRTFGFASRKSRTASEDRFDTNRNSCAFRACPLGPHAVDALVSASNRYLCVGRVCEHPRKEAPGSYAAASL
jgi:hypothetical protein